MSDSELQTVLSDFADLQTEHQSLLLRTSLHLLPSILKLMLTLKYVDTNLADKVMEATRTPTFMARLQYEQRTQPLN